LARKAPGRRPAWGRGRPTGGVRVVNLDEFRAGSYSLPGSDGDDLPDCCFRCVYLQVKGFSVFLSDTFYYFCAYNWPGRLTQTVPPCLEELAEPAPGNSKTPLPPTT
jgi:hypothetical protein